jgi:HTH-type transcriptional regulator/antitoxin HipB
MKFGPKRAIIPDREYHMTAQELGSLIRKTRTDLGLNQDQLAAAAGVGLRFLIELERGKPTVRLDKTLSILDALGLTLAVRPRNARADERP